ncbi:unnamed protein product [Rhizoctonia solani]|uniref:V-type proton ATPase proteolipid subunit n=1 Tax=Rhizoctonia solani TaxID=456999 RepID=A0A8H3DXT0_9AGAM|nr:unnamed protein product [Rhizoctonia solani]
MSEMCPPFAPFFGFAGVASAVSPYPSFLLCATNCGGVDSYFFRRGIAVGAAYGTSKSGIGITGLGTFRPELIMKSLIPVVMSGIIAVYGLVVAVLISGAINPQTPYPPLLWVHSPRRRSFLRIDRALGRLRNWLCRRFVCPCLCPRIQGICHNGVDSDFRGGTGIVWVDCCAYFALQDARGIRQSLCGFIKYQRSSGHV